MYITVFDFGVLFEHKNSNNYHFFNIGDISSLICFLRTNSKSRLIRNVYFFDTYGTNLDLPGYGAMMEVLHHELSFARFTPYYFNNLENLINKLPRKIAEMKIVSEVWES